MTSYQTQTPNIFSECEDGFEDANQTNIVPSLFGLLIFCVHLGNKAIRGNSAGWHNPQGKRSYTVELSG